MDQRSITSSENGKLGGRPLSKATLATQKMKEKVALYVEKNFDKIVKPQIDKAIKGELASYKDLMDRAGVTNNQSQNIIPIQINIGDWKNKYE